MRKLITTTCLALTLSAIGATALAQQTSEARAIDARVVKVKLGGVINLRVKQGPTASLVIVGDGRYVPKVVTAQQGDTLQIDIENNRRIHFGNDNKETLRAELTDIENNRRIHFGNDNKETLRAELTLPNLNELVSQGVGTASIDGFSGERIRLSLDGAGTVTLASRYRNIDASLGGVGSMSLGATDSDRVELSLRGAGRIEVSGKATLLRAKLGGVGSLEARELRADAVELRMTGLGSATVYAKSSADLVLNGLGSASVYGKPASRKSSASGLGSVSWE